MEGRTQIAQQSLFHSKPLSSIFSKSCFTGNPHPLVLNLITCSSYCIVLFKQSSIFFKNVLQSTAIISLHLSAKHYSSIHKYETGIFLFLKLQKAHI